MAIFRLSSGDIAGFKLLFWLMIMYGAMSAVVYYVIHVKFITPLGIDAPLDRFSEARAINHVKVLAKDIENRQAGRPGYYEAAQYIKTELEVMKGRARSNVRIEIEENIVNGSFNMMFLGHSLSLGYRNHTNIVMRVSSVDSLDTDPSVMLNAHFDSPPGSPGAGDCGSCVASILEIARLTIDSGWAPPRPIIFLFNGAEELFMLGSHGFMTSHKWRDTVGAFINVEASGIGGLDLVCQSGPGSWPSSVYAQAAKYPVANSAAQDIFGFVPGDTDYRIFAYDYGNIPGLDIIFLHGSTFYHTASDTVERLLPGSMQARGENLFSVIKAFTNSSKLQSASERDLNNSNGDEKAMYFDFLSWFLIYCSRRQTIVLQSIPITIFLFIPFLLRFRSSGLLCSLAALFDFVKGILFHIVGVLLAVIFPVILSVLRLLFSGQPMNWFSNNYLAYLMFIPCSLAGFLVARSLWKFFPLSQASFHLKSSKDELLDEARFWGAFGLYAIITLAYLLAGLSGGFLTLSSAMFMLPSWIIFCLSVKSFGRESLRSAASYVALSLPCLLHTLYFSGFLLQFLIEKVGMLGSLPPPYGYYVPDAIVAATFGILTGWCLGPLIPVIGHWLGSTSILQFLLHVSVLSLALTSQVFPYGVDSPKRVILQHTIRAADAGQIVDTSYDLSVLDSNSLLFLFKHAPEVAKELNVGSDFSFDTAKQSHRETWMGIYPLSSLFTGSLQFPASRDEILNQYRYLPQVANYNTEIISGDRFWRRLHLEFSLGSLKEVWVAVLNITGPISGWSFANNVLPAPEIVNGSPPSYICRLSGASHENWTFWLEANQSGDIRIEVGIVEQYLMESVNNLKGLFPEWVDVIAYSSFLSTYIF